MRIAILIGITEYKNCNNLPGCLNDIKAVGDLLTTSKEYDEIKIYKNEVNSSDLKKELSDFFAEVKGKDIEEVFFYFTGHGSFYNNEFYYVLSDFDEDKRRQTSLQNLEIDNMIKSVNPEMVTKVIDACQSGVSYIKGNGNIVEKYYSKTLESFKKCYFLHSSMTNQYSYQDDKLSDFTRSFLGAIYANTKPSIRYKDIIDYISDEFERSTEQTPFFVTQADHTESFIKSSKAVLNTLAPYFKTGDLSETKKEEPIKYKSYIEKIKKESELFATQKEVEELFTKIKESVESIELNEELSHLYKAEVSFEHYLSDLPRRIEIGRWLEDNKHSFFAEPSYEKTSYEEEVRPNHLSGLSALLQGTKTVTRYRNELNGFDLTVEMPYKYILINFIPIYSNTLQYGTLITFLFSKKDIKVFAAFTEYKEQGWNKKLISSNFKWQSTDFIIKESSLIVEFIKNSIEDNSNTIQNILKKKFEIDK